MIGKSIGELGASMETASFSGYKACRRLRGARIDAESAAGAIGDTGKAVSYTVSILRLVATDDWSAPRGVGGWGV